MRPSPLMAAAAALLLAAGPAVPQDQNGQPLPIATVTCGDIASVPAPYQAALIYYAAGYRDGIDYARASSGATSTAVPLPVSPTISSQPPVASAPATSSATDASIEGPATAHGSQIVGGLVLQSQDILAACSAAPQAFLTDIIANQGGARGPQGSPSAAPGAPAGAGAVSSDIGAASQQLQDNLAPSAAPGPTTPAPTPGATTSP